MKWRRDGAGATICCTAVSRRQLYKGASEIGGCISPVQPLLFRLVAGRDLKREEREEGVKLNLTEANLCNLFFCGREEREEERK